MHFCNVCSNMYYLKLVNDNCDKLTYYCRNCGDVNTDLIDTNKCILKEKLSKTSSNISINVNKYTKLDVTLPRISYIKCPNDKCESNTEEFDPKNREIIYIRYDDINMKYLYLCSHCDTTWKTN